MSAHHERACSGLDYLPESEKARNNICCFHSIMVLRRKAYRHFFVQLRRV
jgi:hypothetical protein